MQAIVLAGLVEMVLRIADGDALVVRLQVLTSPHVQQVQAHGVLQYKVGGKRVKHEEGGTRVRMEAHQCPHCQAGGDHTSPAGDLQKEYLKY